MTDIETRCLDTFPEWLRTLASDAMALGEVVGNLAAPEPARRFATASLNYLFKSLDLIPDGIEDLGFLDDAFVLRVAASIAVADLPEIAPLVPPFGRLAQEAAIIAELLGDDYRRLETYVRGLVTAVARGRTVQDVLSSEQSRAEFLNEVAGWARSYEPPSFGRDEKNIVKLRSFLSAKLPQA
jgi:uncharacterized membrane protein YkvA (DUF1232 family)